MSRGLCLLAFAALFAGCGYDANSSPYSLELVVPGGSQVDVGATVTVEAIVSDASGLLVTYSWQVVDPQKTSLELSSKSGQSITFVPTKAGSYRVTCDAQVEGFGLRTKSIAIEVGGAGAQLTYRARITPPPPAGVPPFDANVTIGDGVALSHDFTAGDPRRVTLAVSYGGEALPAHVSVLLTPDDPRPQRRYFPTGQGSLSLVSGAMVVVMPEDIAPGAGIAPLVRTVSAAGSAIDVDFDASSMGLWVKGTIERAGAAIDGATVTLRTIDSATKVTLPSTVATTDSQGRYQLRARAGQARLLVVPPTTSQLPMAEVANAKLDVSAAASGWTFRYNAVSSAELGGKVVDDDGKPLAGATVVLSAQSIGDVGELELPGGQIFSASGRYRVVLSSDASGALSAAGKPLVTVPRGTYTVEIVPPVGANSSITLQELVVDGSKTLSLAAARKAIVKGIVRGVDERAVAARVELRGPYGPVVGLAQADKGFELAVDRGFAYTLAVRPLDASLGAPLWQPALLVDGDKSLDPLKLPRATQLSGALRESSGAAIPGALIQLYCEQPTCPRQGLVDQTRTDSAGRYVLRVPRSESAGTTP
ncbi:MAG: hypothetical protein CSA65_08815 [Proteobacteria bacterium]|nr:MAG: hypothetical protein CSB49_07360 [Pseudomonadota bacterium]PIE17472.1 MAG: hypothetical protein CSA65_08815 [Pseudomonadota bacterium]